MLEKVVEDRANGRLYAVYQGATVIELQGNEHLSDLDVHSSWYRSAAKLPSAEAQIVVQGQMSVIWSNGVNVAGYVPMGKGETFAIVNHSNAPRPSGNLIVFIQGYNYGNNFTATQIRGNHYKFRASLPPGIVSTINDLDSPPNLFRVVYNGQLARQIVGKKLHGNPVQGYTVEGEFLV